jgi:AhpC/TSA antioxidant enzyme
LVKNLRLVIIGCGDPSLIKFYATETEAKYPIFADPSQSLFKKFGLARTINPGKKPDYIPYGFWAGFKVFFATLAKAGTSALKAGDVKQVGGEYHLLNEFADVRFLLGPGLKCTWGHKMTATNWGLFTVA